MIRRRFLQSLLAGALGATLADLTAASAQGTAPEATASRTGPTRMDEGRPSVTAQSTATLRAAHQIQDGLRVGGVAHLMKAGR